MRITTRRSLVWFERGAEAGVFLTRDNIPMSKHGIAVQRERARQSTPAQTKSDSNQIIRLSSSSLSTIVNNSLGLHFIKPVLYR